MAEIKFNTEETKSNDESDVVIEGLTPETDGKVSRVTITPEQATAVRTFLAQKDEKKEEKDEHLGDFENTEALSKAYKELRTKMSETKAEPTAEEKATAAKVTADAEAEAQKKGVDMQKYVEEWTVGKALSDASYTELAGKGFTKEIVDNYIAGRIAVVTEQTGTLYETVGGEESYKTLLEWGKANLPEEAQQAYDRLLNAGDYEAAGLALRGFVQQYNAAEGTTPAQTVTAASVDGNSTGAQAFASKSDMIAAINDRRYKTGDKAYIASVEARMHATNVAGLVS